ncbi:MAG TPA: hypothetical protein VGJ15_09340, partial [Pirellulales bacterium]
MHKTIARFWVVRLTDWLFAVLICVFVVCSTRGFAQQTTAPLRTGPVGSNGAAKPSEFPLPRLETAPTSRRGSNGAAVEAAAGARASGTAGTYGSFTAADGDPADLQPSAIAPGGSVFATAFDDPPPQPAATVDVATFNGIQPGETTADDLLAKWGEGKLVSHNDTETVINFSVDSFPQVEVTLVDKKVRTIVVHLEQPLPPDTLARKLQLEDVRPVNVPDDSGELLGQAYPERGVLFSITPDGKRVAHVVLERVDLTPFVLRAEMDLQTHTRSSLADLNYVLSRQSRNSRALWLRAKLLADMA